MSPKPPLKLKDHLRQGVPLIGQVPEVPPLCVRAAGDLWSSLIPAIGGALEEANSVLSLAGLPPSAVKAVTQHRDRLATVLEAAKSTHARALAEACAPGGPMERTAQGLGEHVLKISEALERDYGKPTKATSAAVDPLASGSGG